MNEITTRILKLLLLFFAVVLGISIFYHLLYQNYETETAVYAEVRDFTSFQGVYIRSETVEPYSGTGAVRYCADDGEKLGVGTVIAEVYPDETQIDLRRTIAEKEEELALLQRITNPGTTEHAQPGGLSKLIAEQYKSMIRMRERGQFTEIAAASQELNVLMNTYSKITDPEVDLQPRILSLEEEIGRLKLQEIPPDQIIRAKKSAYFISYVDGWEEVLKPDNIRRLTAEQLSGVTDDTISADPQATHAIGKLVDDYAWYIAGTFDNRKLRLSEGDSVTVRMESLARPIKVRVESLISAGDISKTQAVFRCDQFTHDVVQHRTERIDIVRDSVEGIRVPQTAVRFREMELTKTEKDDAGNEQTVTYRDKVKGVYVQSGEKAEFRRVEVLYEDDNFLISKLDAGSGYVSLYDDIIVKGVMTDDT